MNIGQFEARKREHIQHSLDHAHQAYGLSGLEQMHLIHNALPEIDFEDIRLSSSCLGKSTLTPFYVAGMTAGHEDALQINRVLALACQERGWAMGVGSQRRDLDSSTSSVDQWRRLREEVSNLLLFANIGISQLISTEVSQIRKLVDDLGAHALVVHTNALQEALQPEGTPRFRGGLAAIRKCCNELEIPVVLKETGCGFSRATLEELSKVGLGAIDVSGLGGTHWGRIEGTRAGKHSIQGVAAQTFKNWGESTFDSVKSAVEALSDIEIWASGGIRSGLDSAKLIALGAHRIGYAKPALEAALEGPEKLKFWMQTQEYELKVALFCTGSMDCNALRRKDTKWKRSVT